MHSISRLSVEQSPFHSHDQVSPADTRETEITKLGQLIRNASFTELGRFQPRYPADAAQLCHELVLEHRDAVTAMLVNERVSEETLQLLKQASQDPQHDLDERRRALAEAVLNARPCLKHSRALPLPVEKALDERRLQREDYWDAKTRKHNACKGGIVSYRDKGEPFLHNNRNMSVENNNCKLGKKGKNFACRHLAVAIAQAEQPKEFLKLISQKKVDHLTYDELEKTHRDQVRRTGKTSVQFSREKFGELLATIHALSPARSHSYAVGYPYTSTTDTGHAMHVFMERPRKPLSSESCLKVSFYEPNVTGDMTHLNALPEELAALSIDAFDRRSMCQGWGVNVLSMDVQDPELAQALVGKFVKDDVSSQTSSLATALAYGNVREVEAAASKLTDMLLNEEQSSWPGGQITELANGLNYAMQDGHADAIEAFGRFLESIQHRLKPEDLKAIVLAKRSDGVPGMQMASQNGHANAIEALGRIVESIQHRLTPEGLEEILSAKRADGTTGMLMALQNGHANVIKAYAELIIRIQSHPLTRLRGKHALALLKAIRNSHGGRPLVAFGFWVNWPFYKRVVKQDAELYKLFKQAKASLKVDK